MGLFGKKLASKALFGASVAALSIVMSTAAWAEPREFNVPSEDAVQAIPEFARQAGIQIIAPASQLRGVQTPAVQGNLEPREALQQLLRGTGLEIASDDGRVITLRNSNPTQLGAAEEAGSSAGEEEITVTGTRIRGAAPAGSSVVVISREDIEESGYGTVQDYLRSVPQFGPGISPDFAARNQTLDAGNFGYGSGLDLRGLGIGTTLVLINGHRQAAAGTTGNFVDISTIPASAVDRIEILLDGASAIYGSDAIGGVVNIILRRDYIGAETNLRFGTYGGDASETRLSQSFGTSWQGGHLFAGVEYYERERLPATSRSFSADTDQRRNGGDNFNSTISNPGNIYDPTTFEIAYAIPRGQDGRNLTPADLLAGQINYQNLSEGFDILPEEQSTSAFLTVSQRVLQNTELSLDARYTHRPISVRNQAGSVASFLFVPNTNAFFVDPFGGQDFLFVDYDVSKDFSFDGTGDTNEYSANLSAATDLTPDWRSNVAIGYSVNSLRFSQGGFDPDAFAAALADSNPDTAFNAFGDGSNTNPATLALIANEAREASDSNTLTADVSVDGPLFNMPAGAARVAFGGSYVRDTIDTGQGTSRTGELSRNVTSAFAELSLPVIGPEQNVPLAYRVQLSLAERYDSYSDVGETTNPKIGLSWFVTPELGIRASWGTSFRAASLTTYDPTAFFVPQYGATTYASPSGPKRVLVLTGFNPDLRPETSTSWTFGLDFQASDHRTRASLTYSDVLYENRIGRAGTPGRESQILFEPELWGAAINAAPTPEEITAICTSGHFLGPPSSCTTPTPMVIVDRRLRNLAYTKAQAIDFRAEHDFDLGPAALTLGLNGVYNIANERAFVSGAPTVDVINTLGNPLRLHLQTTAVVTYGRVQGRAALNYSPSYDDVFGGLSGVSREVDSFTSLDFDLLYTLGGPLGSPHSTTIALNVTNLADADPPWTNTPFGYDSANAEPYGREITLRLVRQW